MKKIVAIVLVAGLATVFSCKKLDKLTQFYMDYNFEVTVPANSVINLPIDILSPDITTNYQDKFEANDTRKDLVDEIKIDNITIEVKAPAGMKLDFLKSINVFISADGLPEKEVAWVNDVPDGLTTLTLEHTGDNLKEYLSKETIKFRVKTVTDKALNQNTDLNVKSRFFVNANVLGA